MPDLRRSLGLLFDQDAVDHTADQHVTRWGGTVAFATKYWKPSAAVAVPLIAACNRSSGTLKAVRDKSDVAGFIWRTTTYKAYQGGYETTAELLPQ
jgi:hypothetical protein